jgi:hypothetical protein
MSAVDFTDADARERALHAPLNFAVNAAVERATAAGARMPRAYLGASIVGHECLRHVQYEWWCVPELPARLKLIFDRGHAFEALVKAQLKQAGFAFAPEEAFEFVALGGFLQGHADGVIIAAPPLPGAYLATPCLWECKALNAKNFRAVARDGFAQTFPRYAAQVALYQLFLGKENPALITCVDANSCEVLHLALPFSAERARATVERAETIIAATRAGELLPRFTDNPQDWRCRICSHRGRRWGTP